MTNIEVIICLMLLFMAVPDVCRKFGRPALAFSAFVIVGFLLGPLTHGPVRTLLDQAGQVGFLLLLFEVGLEIDLPRLTEFVRPLRYAASWALLQCQLAFGLSIYAGLDWKSAFVAAAALTACSVGMAHPAWKSYPGFEAAPRFFMLHVMVALEVIAIVILAIETTLLKSGLTWIVVIKLAGIVCTVFLIARFAAHLKTLFQSILQNTTHWRVHWLVLLVLGVCAVGNRLGLDAAKTAFFLGLAMSSTKHDGLSLASHIAPVSHRFLIPIFFVSLGLKIEWNMLVHWTTLLAVGSAGLILGAREVVYRRGFKIGGDDRAFLLLCPNLTIVALAVKAMQDHGSDSKLTVWLLLTGLFVTIPSLFLLPAGKPEIEPDATNPPASLTPPATSALP